MKNIVLVTAPPRTGKSTLIKKIVEQMGEQNFCGFFTEEILKEGERVGFKVKELNGVELVFAHVDIVSSYKISKYNVDIEGFEKFVAGFFQKISRDKILVIDEIGPMQVLSPLFREKITKLFNTPVAMLGTVFLDQHAWLDKVKRSDKIDLVNLTTQNRNTIVQPIVEKISTIQKHYSDISEELKRKEVKSDSYVKLFDNQNEHNKTSIKTEHGVRQITYDSVLGFSCSCDFYKKANTCSHIIACQKARSC